MPTPIRLQRIADRIRRDLSEMLIQEVNDPRLDRVFITDVEVDRELAFADIYISAIEGSQRSKEILTALFHAGGFLRRQLAAKIELRVFPRLRFHWDPTPENADHIEKLLAEIQKKDGPSDSH